MLPDEADAYTNFCGHTYTTGNCPAPTGLPRIDSQRLSAARRATACRSTTSGGRSTAQGQPVDAHGHVLKDADGVPLAPAPRTKTCETTGEDYGITLDLEGLVVSLLRRTGAPDPRLLRRDQRAHQRRRRAGRLLLPGPPRLLRDLLRDLDAVLSLLLAAGALTAVIAGIAGAWSPCGFSMVDTIGTALGDARRSVMVVATATFTIGALAGGVVTFGGLALLGGLLGHGASDLRDALAGALALAAAFADWRGWRIAPQIRRQVPERWRWIMPLPLACALYGLLLGLGFTTFVLSFAVWALAGISVAADSALARRRRRSRVRTRPRAAGAVDRPAARHRTRRPMRSTGSRSSRDCGSACAASTRSDSGVCAVLLGGSSALAAAIHLRDRPLGPTAARTPGSSSAAPGMVRTAAGTLPLPGRLPAVGGANVAWLSGTRDRDLEGLSVAGAADDPRSAARDGRRAGDLRPTGWSCATSPPAGSPTSSRCRLHDPARRRYLAGAGTPGAIGRPSVDGSTVVYAYSSTTGSGIYEVDLGSGARRVLRGAAAATC